MRVRSYHILKDSGTVFLDVIVDRGKRVSLELAPDLMISLCREGLKVAQQKKIPVEPVNGKQLHAGGTLGLRKAE